MNTSIETQLIDGKAFAEKMTKEVAAQVAELQQTTGVTPGLAVILVGNDPASEVYVRNKTKQTHKVGMRSFMHLLPETTTQQELLTLIQRLNNDPDIHGILVQLPLPKHLDSDPIIQAILPEKDVDGLTAYNAGKLTLGHTDGFIPCTPLGCLLLLQQELSNLRGLNALVIGASNLMGKPMAQLLLNQGCTVTIAHIDTRNTEELARQADILIVATGCKELVKGSWVKKGAVIIDVGINRITTEENKVKLVGDVAFHETLGIASKITPVPGGVGPVTISCLLYNALSAAKKKK
ncbi:5 [Commensalibacter communis]|uniref:Bifunctional protein FolD n=1 Tax=Commensalibacter communis TaxID=2972786 RepID=A0A9W4XD89_9PROT|nr:bifunctional methylenetetrahydrofolate dehydrogenase/methenyltetrahydrofolate cyclohydrolase FolD [Commensalibacter communis]CAI3938073.1 5 [Commensalibacter communis] [Commensalibacter communis]CAI3938281.1 5 [Commensalibacter communis] [Commensalibacter communis]CAI3940145.1 5 [Commensalibacter communis] [Commensalibacter communis]CAI3941450.1 5 [Commensalibacter communis] [Commensalibacter communis]CAI3942060.1 5 [Commensalibacter communis] [Commensalibacter communis]